MCDKLCNANALKKKHQRTAFFTGKNWSNISFNLQRIAANVWKAFDRTFEYGR